MLPRRDIHWIYVSLKKATEGEIESGGQTRLIKIRNRMVSLWALGCLMPIDKYYDWQINTFTNVYCWSPR